MTNEYWRSTQGGRFLVLARGNPTEESDLWVEYRDCHAGQVYACRLPAFEHGFFPRTD
jgi:hypothetical protein